MKPDYSNFCPIEFPAVTTTKGKAMTNKAMIVEAVKALGLKPRNEIHDWIEHNLGKSINISTIGVELSRLRKGEKRKPTKKPADAVPVGENLHLPSVAEDTTFDQLQLVAELAKAFHGGIGGLENAVLQLKIIVGDDFGNDT